MSIGIIGAGAIGSAFARALARAGIEATLANSRGPASLAGSFADLVPGARVVKAFNHLKPALLAGDPHAEGGRRVLFHAGDDDAAKAEVAALIERLGFFGLDLGTLAGGGRLLQFPGGPLPAHNLVRFD